MNAIDQTFEYQADVSSAADFQIDEAAGVGRSAPVVVRLARGLDQKQDLLTEYVRQLALPNYFGGNWDALEECLRDLAWLQPSQGVIVAHAGLPLRGRSRAIYLNLLADVARHWRGSHVRTVRVIFPLRLERTIQLIAAQAASA
jgi:hypothetical protein